MNARNTTPSTDAKVDAQAQRIAQLMPKIARAILGGPSNKGKMRSTPADLTWVQARCLLSITHHNNCTLRELSQRLGIKPSTASALVDRLVRDGFIDRSD